MPPTDREKARFLGPSELASRKEAMSLASMLGGHIFKSHNLVRLGQSNKQFHPDRRAYRGELQSKATISS